MSLTRAIPPFVIRPWRADDVAQIVQLFHETVHAINANDYSAQQLDAWAPTLSSAEQDKQETRFLSLLNSRLSYVAERNGTILGFADATNDGYLDHLYTHRNYQGIGVASTLVQTVEGKIIALGVPRVTTDASITARPFFERRGYRVVQPQMVTVRGVTMQNFRMEKWLHS
ncbi:acetyltransferase [Alicyclobacillus acidoterrestris]|nr:acetyltransferase [Alicyclobacillus acidoterrestris]